MDFSHWLVDIIWAEDEDTPQPPPASGVSPEEERLWEDEEVSAIAVGIIGRDLSILTLWTRVL